MKIGRSTRVVLLLLSLRCDVRLEGGRTDHALRMGLIFHW
jgi:hypothetical protein